jgi:hypothetical protein
MRGSRPPRPLTAGAAFLSLPANAERVCRQECSAGVCKEQCVESTDRERDRVIIEGRGDRRDERREERRQEKPGVELKVPVEIGR